MTSNSVTFYIAGVGQLNVYLNSSNTGNLVRLFNQSGNHGDRWMLGQADISYRSTYYIVFEGVRGNSITGDIALDDITVNSGSCAGQVTGTTPSAPITTACK